MTRITIELGGGLDHLFGGVKVHEVDVPAAAAAAAAGDGGGGGGNGSGSSDRAEPLTVARLLPWARDHLVKERPELFMKGDSVRPGIIVLINDCDWELCGGLDTALQDGDRILFISTLHGG